MILISKFSGVNIQHSLLTFIPLFHLSNLHPSPISPSFSIYSFLSVLPLFTSHPLSFLPPSPNIHTHSQSVSFLLACLGENHICLLPLACWYGKWRAATNENRISDPVPFFFFSLPALLCFRLCFIPICTFPFHLSLLHPLKASPGSKQKHQMTNVNTANTHTWRDVSEEEWDKTGEKETLHQLCSRLALIFWSDICLRQKLQLWLSHLTSMHCLRRLCASAVYHTCKLLTEKRAPFGLHSGN